MIVAGTWRGQPLAALVLIVAAWIAVRAIMWQAGIVEPPAVAMPVPVPVPVPVQPLAAGFVPPFTPVARPAAFSPPAALPVLAQWRASGRLDGHPVPSRPVPSGPVPSGPVPFGQHLAPLTAAPAAASPPSLLPGPRAADDPPASTALPGAASFPAGDERRWSADSWVMLRAGGNGALAAGGGAPATYGASQAGAVLRYRLAPGSGHRPAAYLRATAALNGSNEKEAALGVSVRPVAALPIVGGVELRAAQQSERVRLRPAVLLVSELPVIALPAALQAEAYVQAGYVAGRFATAFADGQVRVDRPVGAVGRGRLSLGAAAWGGAQKGVARLDLGPAARVAVPLGKAAAARIGVDWRVRVAGNAAPSSGPALTLSAGF